MIDSHVHLGQYYNIYTTPSDLLQMMDSVGVEQFAASSTSICEGDYAKVLREMKELSAIAQERLYPVLWIIPSMLTDEGLERFLDSGIQWKCLKIHPQLNPYDWQEYSPNLDKVVSLAKKMNVPLLIHTGETTGCYPMQFQKAIADNSSVNFILAHARPIDQTIQLMKQYPNAWTDTAFVPIDNIVKLCEEGLSDRILWGTDYPIPKYYYKKVNMEHYYKELVKSLSKSLTQCYFNKIAQINALFLLGRRNKKHY